jgi:hypothetical protein
VGVLMHKASLIVLFLALLTAAAQPLLMPLGPDTVVARNTTDTLTNKTLVSPVISNPNITGLTAATTCPSGQAVTAVSGTLGFTCSSVGGSSSGAVDFSALTGVATDAQIPDNITIDLATLATTATTANAISFTVGIGSGGTGQTSQTPAFDALAPTTTQGDISYHNGTDNVRLAKGTALQVLRINAGETAPEWATVSGGSGLTHAEVMSRAALRF